MRSLLLSVTTGLSSLMATSGATFWRSKGAPRRRRRRSPGIAQSSALASLGHHGTLLSPPWARARVSIDAHFRVFDAGTLLARQFARAFHPIGRGLGARGGRRGLQTRGLRFPAIVRPFPRPLRLADCGCSPAAVQ